MYKEILSDFFAYKKVDKINYTSNGEEYAIFLQNLKNIEKSHNMLKNDN